jgi:hypothetical protein
MMRWIGAAALLAIVAASPATAAGHGTPQQAADAGARRQFRHHDTLYRYVPPAPRYYARPLNYSPYPYGVPAPFVLGYGPWW